MRYVDKEALPHLVHLLLVLLLLVLAQSLLLLLLAFEKVSEHAIYGTDDEQ